MATEHIPQIDKLMKEFGEQFRKDVRQANKAIEQAIKGINQLKESEGKTTTHEVEITTTENRVVEEYWVMRGIKNVTDDCLHTTKKVIAERERGKIPTPQEIAQFLSESKADFVSVEHNYRFADLPFC